MTTAAMVLAAVLAVAAVLWVARPLLAPGLGGEPGGGGEDEVDRELLRLLEARDRALAALKELEFDHRTGKITDGDYQELVGPLRAEATETLTALDALAAAGGPPPRPPGPNGSAGGASAVPAGASDQQERPQ